MLIRKYCCGGGHISQSVQKLRARSRADLHRYLAQFGAFMEDQVAHQTFLCTNYSKWWCEWITTPSVRENLMERYALQLNCPLKDDKKKKPTQLFMQRS